MNEGNITMNYLREANAFMASRRIPNTVILMFFLFIGIIGNSCVLTVYGRGMRKCREDRFFIPYLALVDLFACVFSSVLCIITNYFAFNFPSNGLCKITWYISWSSTAISVIILLLIALQRYLKICRPHGKQMDFFWRRLCLIIAVIGTLILSLPFLFFTGHIPVTLKVNGKNITGYYCSFGAGGMSTFQDVYFAIIFILDIVNLIATACLYIPIGYIIFKTSWIFNNQRPKAKTSLTAEEYSNQISDKYSRNSPDEIKESTTKHVSCTKYKGLGKGVRNRFSLMLISIMSAYALSNIPSIVMIVASYSDPEFLFATSDLEMNILLTARRLYIVNNIVNPFIYSYFDLKFRHEFKKIVCYAFKI